MRDNKQIAGPSACDVPHSLAFERLVALFFVVGRHEFGGHDAAKHPMQRVVRSAMDELRRRRKFSGRVDRDNDRPFQTLRTVDCDDLDGVIRGIDPPLSTRCTCLPVGLQVPHEGAKTRDVVGPCHLDHGIEVRERPCAAATMPGGKDDA